MRQYPEAPGDDLTGGDLLEDALLHGVSACRLRHELGALPVGAWTGVYRRSFLFKRTFALRRCHVVDYPSVVRPKPRTEAK